MSLFYRTESGSYLNCGRNSAVDNLAAGTVAAWVRVFTWSPAGNYFSICTKGSAGYSVYNSCDIMPATPGPIGGLDAYVSRATTDWNLRSGEALVFLNQWCFIAKSWDISLTAADQHLYGGALNSAVREPSSYSTRDAGSGSLKDDSPYSIGIGNFAAPNAGEYYDGGSDREINWVGLWPRQLSLGELDQVRRETMARMIRPRGALLYTYLGRDSGIQPDLSGNGLHGTLGTTSVAAFPGSVFPSSNLTMAAILAGSASGGAPPAKMDGMFFAAV